MRIIEEVKLDFQDVLLKPKRSTIYSRKLVRLEREFSFKNSHGWWKGIPIISANMSSITNRTVAIVMEHSDMLACLPKSNSTWGFNNNHAMPSVGIGDPADFMCVNERFLCIDVANGYMEALVSYVKIIREKYPMLTILAGNVVSPEMTEALILAGADIVKVGIGSGASCATRVKTGVGYPQLSAVIECADAAHGLGGYICSDGGCTNPGDVAKAFAGGADFVMLGGMLAGHDENGTDFYGSSSKRANEETAGGLKEYRASEGWEIKIPSRGPLANTLQDILGGLRSACAYTGAICIKDLPKCATFVKVNRQINESLLRYKA